MAQSTRCLDVFILSGQSNMAGRGGVQRENGTQIWNKIVPMSANVSDGSVLRLTAGLNWELAREPLHQDIDHGKVCGVGPGLVFGATVFKYLKEREETNPAVIGLVPCAIGGTSIIQWEKGGKLYNQMIHRAEVARRSGGTLKALLWYQGESDADSRDRADLYKSRLEKLFTDIRADLNDQMLPIIQVKITGPYPFLKEIRAAQAAVHVPRVYTVDAWGLELNPDHIHLTTKSQEKLGIDMADQYVREVLSQCGG